MSSGLRGQRVVVGIYLIIVAFTGVAGYMTATVVGEIDPPRLLFLIELPPTPIGLAVFGAVTIGLVLGVLLFAVTVVSDRFDDADPGRDEPLNPAVDGPESDGSKPEADDPEPDSEADDRASEIE